ncbi:helix-turn-helix domain-containing protein [Paenibacillus aceris]|uniref:AraC-like DNA-binding protein n=1 Tax=Paenibacillus aceris TaxID=869555 RepID=A0ABS4HV46_9BACL|nr:AraC family transcriptional regulator [Paenibacillus aceris]MBP1962405.1 AraC-like DNA-binding protein [Paenibacillus aceris]NHW37220.1 AraC family transcriptional regulator [Paenibacillus aceris]
MPSTVTFGNEDEGPFYIQHIHRSGSFERTQHMHDMYELYYLYEGERMYFIRDRSYLILPGDLVLINRRELHATSDSDKLGHARVVMNFSDTFLESVKDDAPFLLDAFTHATPVLRLDLPTRRFVEDILGKMILEAKETHLGQTFALRHFLIELLLFTARFVRLHPVTSPEHVSPLHRKISTIVRFINTHFAESMRLEELAERFEISPAYLSRMFKEITGFSLVEYVNLVRVQEAQRLLTETKVKVIVIAEQVGFGSLVQFGRVFRQITKTTPLRYRQTAVT